MKFTTTATVALLATICVAVQPAAAAGKMNAAGLKLLKSFEGYRSNFYTDPTGHKTICYGLNCDAHPSACNALNPPVSEAKCSSLLVSQTLPEYEKCACAMEGMSKANANQYSALVDFAYNAGCGALQSEFPGAVKKGNFAGIADVLPHTYTNNGLAGLVRRRKAEAALMREATTAKSGC